MLNLCKHIEALCGAGNGLSDDFSRHVGSVYTMTRVSLRIEDIGGIRQPADLWQAVGADTNHTAPFEINADAFQLREYTLQVWQQSASDIFRIFPE